MFQLVFKGECVPGTEPEAARTNARALFKASTEQLERMFSGQPVVIRNKLEEAQAGKYQAVLRKHGMVAYVQPMPGAEPPAQKTPEAPAAPAPSATTASAPEPKPAPARQQPVATEPGDRLQVAGDKVDEILSGTDFSLDPVGVTLAEPTTVDTPMFQHIDDWTLAPAGSDLGVKKDLPPPVVPDVSHLSLAEDDPAGNKGG
jgi:hypothetical protein